LLSTLAVLCRSFTMTEAESAIRQSSPLGVGLFHIIYKSQVFFSIEPKVQSECVSVIERA